MPRSASLTRNHGSAAATHSVVGDIYENGNPSCCTHTHTHTHTSLPTYKLPRTPAESSSTPTPADTTEQSPRSPSATKSPTHAQIIGEAKIRAMKYAPNLFKTTHIHTQDTHTIANGCSKQDLLDAVIVKGGTTNTLVHVWKVNNPNVSCLVRFFGHNTSKWIDRTREHEILTFLAQYNMGKEVIASFEGGTVESWIVGEPLKPSELLDNAQQIAFSLVRLHTIKLDINNPATKHVATFDARGNFSSSLWSSLWNFFTICKEERAKIETACLATCNVITSSPAGCLLFFDFASIERILRQLEVEAKKKKSPVVLCHADLLAGNIIKLPDGTVRLIDFEYSATMERAFDLANHFLEYAGFECLWGNCPSVAEQRHFLLHYVCACDSGLDSAEIEDRVHRLLEEIQPFFGVSHIFWGLWALVQAVNSTVEFDFIKYAFGRMSKIMINGSCGVS